MQGISQKIIKNTFFNTIGNFFSAILNLVLIPYLMISLGPERFGIWALVSVIFGLFTTLNLGSGTAFLKYFSEYEAKKDTRSFNEVLMAGFTIMLLLTCVLVGVFIVMLGVFVTIFNIPEELAEEARFVFLSAGVIFGFNNVFSVFPAVIRGLQRMEITNLISVVSSTLFVFAVLIALKLGFGLRGLVIIQGFKIVGINLASAYFAKKIFKDLSFSLFHINLLQIRKVLRYGLKMQVSNIANLISLQTDKILIGYFLTLSDVAFYEIGQKIALFGRMLVTVCLSALVPAVSELDSSGRTGYLMKLYEKGNKYLLSIVFPITIFMIVFAGILVRVWMGEGYSKSIMVVRLLTIGVMVNALTGVGVKIVRGLGMPIYETQYAIIAMVLNISLGIVLVRELGFEGVVVATTFSVVTGSVYFLIRFHRLFVISLKTLAMRVYVRPFLLSVGIASAIWMLNALVYRVVQVNLRIEFLLLIVADGFLYFTLYFVLLSKSRFWDKEDEVLFLTTVRRIPFLDGFVAKVIAFSKSI